MILELQLQLYVWDELEYMPLLVRNKAAELLFGNIRAERVYHSYKEKTRVKYPHTQHVPRENHYNPKATGVLEFTEGVARCRSRDAEKGLEVKEKHQYDKNMNFYLIWLVLLKMLLRKGQNSPLKFEVAVKPSLDVENGRFEMVSVSAPCVSTSIQLAKLL